MTESDLLTRQVPPSVANAIESERKYQEQIWNADTTQSGGMHSESEFLVFMQDYLREAMTIVSRNPEPYASEEAAHVVRKVSAMALACAVKNDWLESFEKYMAYNKAGTSCNIVQAIAIMQACLNKAFDSLYDNSLEGIRINLVLTFMAGTQAMENIEIYPMRGS